MVKWLSTKLQELTVKSEVAMDILQFFCENGVIGVGHPVEWGGFTMSAAVQSRRSDIVWWLYRHIPDVNVNFCAALMSAVTTGDIVIPEWLIQHGAEWPEETDLRNVVRGVAAQGRLDVLDWLEERGLVTV
ncbi:uncharacterized protein KRP23_348 [Phytophthora ramorum]|uniref:uncharacterized protein n=1 Tax=Phytophthora ramorum TaxID=164328 RepID=UPI0030AF9885|nr:hypothetical protein KRP23_348 [Phytophthora ramorum]